MHVICYEARAVACGRREANRMRQSQEEATAWSPVTPKPDLAMARAACEWLHLEADDAPHLEAAGASPEEAAWRLHAATAQQALLARLSQLLHGARLVQGLPGCISRCAAPHSSASHHIEFVSMPSDCHSPATGLLANHRRVRRSRV